jgi:DNA processing protein
VGPGAEPLIPAAGAAAQKGAVGEASELADWLALHHAPGIGARRCAALLERFGSPRGVREAGREQLRAGGLVPASAMDALLAPDWAAVERELEWARQPGRAILTRADTAYPPLLAEIPDPPPVLYVLGDVDALSSLQIAIVGSRNPSPEGRATAERMARFLAAAGLTVASGMAIGIDAAAHLGALAAPGTTVAVAGTGLDRVYPARHRDLAHRIAGQGALVSELPLGSGPLRGNFPRRNRILSGLSLGVVVVEAALKSGSLISARHAMEQGREVFAVPGSIHNPLAKGCHWLIRQGAKLVETAQDIVEELGPLMGAAQEALQAHDTEGEQTGEVPEDEAYRSLLDCLGYDPTPVDLLVERSGLAADAVSSMLLILELRGIVSAHPGGAYARVA